MENFYKTVCALIPSSRFRSLEDLSRHAFDGKSKYLANAFGKGQDISLSRAKRVADALGVPLDALINDQGVEATAPDHFVDVLRSISETRSVDCLGGLVDFVDLYHRVKPGDRTLKPYKLGKHSLLTRILQRRDIANLRRGIQSLPPEVDSRLFASYEAAAAGLPVLSLENFNEDIAVHPFRVSVTYVRLLLAVEGPDQIPLVLNYSHELSRK